MHTANKRPASVNHNDKIYTILTDFRKTTAHTNQTISYIHK